MYRSAAMRDLEFCASLLFDVGDSRTQDDLNEGNKRGRHVQRRIEVTDLSGGKIPSLERKLSRAVRSRSNLPDRGSYGIPGVYR